MNNHYCELISPNDSVHRTYSGTFANMGNYTATASFVWHVDVMFPPEFCNFEIGTFTLRLGWDVANSDTSTRPFNVWNPNSADEARGHQTFSVMNAFELYSGEDGNLNPNIYYISFRKIIS